MISEFYTKNTTDVNKRKNKKKISDVKTNKKPSNGVVDKRGGRPRSALQSPSRTETQLQPPPTGDKVKAGTWTSEQLMYMKNIVPSLEEHQRLQILHFIVINNC